VINAGGRTYAHNYTPAKDPVNVFKAAVQLCFHRAYAGPPLTGPLRLECVFIFPRPKSKVWKTKPMPRVPHTGKPDRDNLLKSLQDALNGLAYRDDSQIFDGVTSKWIAAGDEPPHVEVFITEETHGAT